MISDHTQFKFYDTLNHKINISDFEQWVYETKALESELPEEDYIELISINFKDKYVLNELKKVVGKYIQHGEFETKRVSKMLESIINRDERCADSIYMTYDLYCKGYSFFSRLGLTYGLIVAAPPVDNYRKEWHELEKAQQDEVLDKLYPAIIQDAKKALNWFLEGKIIFKDTLNGQGAYEYDDLRRQEDVQQEEIRTVDLDKIRKRKWWEFWK